jgi:hypothetical protein
MWVPHVIWIKVGAKPPIQLLWRRKCRRKPQNPEKGWKTLKSKKFAYSGLYFERLANSGLFQVRRANIGLNFEISRGQQMDPSH